MAIHRLVNATTTTTTISTSGIDDDSTRSVGSSAGRNDPSSPLSRSRNKSLRERPPAQHEPQQLSSKYLNRQQRLQSSCSLQGTVLTGMLLLCVLSLSFTMNWNDMKGRQQSMFTMLLTDGPQRQQSTVTPGQQDDMYTLTLIPSIDEIALGVKSQDSAVRRQAAVDISTELEEESDDFVDIGNQTSLEIDYSLDRPPLDTIINEDDEIVGNPEWLLDFAILGYGKCGTSTMMHWLREHPEIQAFGREKGHFMGRNPGLMIRQLYENLEPGPYQRGYKAPQDVTQVHILNYYRTYWPNAKLILGIRHPIRWFESLYNFRIQNLKVPTDLPHPSNLIGPCRQGRFLTCTNKGDFAYSLLKLGQQNYPQPRPPTELELSIVNRYNRTSPFDTTSAEYMSNPIFIFELDQLGDSNVTRNELFRSDFTKFMGLQDPLPALPHYIPGMKRETKEQMKRDALKIKICDDDYISVRQELMILSRSTSQWIRDIFLNGPTVHVSSKEYFVTILEGWMHDPCDHNVFISDTADLTSSDQETKTEG